MLNASLGDGLPYRMQISTGSVTISCSADLSWRVSSINGEPLSVHMLRYASADLGARNGLIIPLTNKNLHNSETSITRSSMRNSFKYFRTSRTLAESGDPRFINSIPLLRDGFITMSANVAS